MVKINMRSKKKILYLTRLSPYEIKSWSGVNLNILNCLKKNFEVITVGPLSNRVRILYILKRFFYSKLNIKFDIDRPIFVAKDFANQIHQKIKNTNYDAVLTTDSYLLTFFKTKKPCFIFTDVLFSTYYSHYFNQQSIHKSTLIEGNYCQKKALLKCKEIFLTSRWAIRDAIKCYKIKKRKFRILPFGPSSSIIPTKKILLQKIKKKNLNECILVTIGVHWNRKGMNKALNLVKHLNYIGQKTKLYIIGATPPKDISIPKYVKLIRFLDKNIKKDRKLLEKILFKAHFNVLFSQSEAFGVVNVEASAFGLYSITNKIGGIDGAIKNNMNGFMFNKNENLNIISKHLLKIFKNKNIFKKKSLDARNQYEKNLNWYKISNQLFQKINKYL